MRRRRFLLASLLWLVSGTPPLLAYSTGITGYSGKNIATCNSCHTGGQAPDVTLVGPATLDRGTGVFTLTIRSNNPVQGWAGFNIAASGGTLLVVDRSTQQKVANELTHKTLIESDANDAVAVAFAWRAPTRDGLYTLYAAGNSVNANDATSGDRATTTTFVVAVGVSAPPSATATPTATASPTPVPPTLSPTQTATASTSATASHTFTSTLTAAPTATTVPTDTITATAASTPSNSATCTPTAVASATAPATPTDTTSPTVPTPSPPRSTETPEPQDTASLEGSPTALPSPTPTMDTLFGDANCDQRVTAADVPALVVLLATNGGGRCGADVNASGAIDAADVEALISRVFERSDG